MKQFEQFSYSTIIGAFANDLVGIFARFLAKNALILPEMTKLRGVCLVSRETLLNKHRICCLSSVFAPKMSIINITKLDYCTNAG